MTALEEHRLKSLLKDALAEVLEENRDLLRDAFQEALEDAALLRAIREAETSPLTTRKRVFRELARTV